MSFIHRFKEGDFYTCSLKNEDSMSNHAFEGLVGTVIKEGKVYFYDTFWGIHSPGQYAKRFTVDDIGTVIELAFLANINDLEKTSLDATKYYDEDDIVMLHEQHACSGNCKELYIRKGAKRSKQKIKDSLESKIDSITNKMDSLVREKDRLQSLLDSVDDPDTLYNIWI